MPRVDARLGRCGGSDAGLRPVRGDPSHSESVVPIDISMSYEKFVSILWSAMHSDGVRWSFSVSDSSQNSVGVGKRVYFPLIKGKVACNPLNPKGILN